jgi:hypothetical protein
VESLTSIQVPKMFARFRKDYKPRAPPPDVGKILQRVTDCAGEFQRALTGARDESLQRVDNNVQGIAVGVGMLYQDAKGTNKNTKTIIHDVREVSDKLDLVREQSAEAREEEKRAREEERQAREEDRQARTEDRLAKQKSDADFQKFLQARAKQDKEEKTAIAERERFYQDQINNKNSMLSILVEQQKRKSKDPRNLSLVDLV